MKVYCIGGPLNGQHVDIDPGASTYRHAPSPERQKRFRESSPFFEIEFVSIDYRRVTVSADDPNGVASSSVLVASSLTVGQALRKVFGYD